MKILVITPYYAPDLGPSAPMFATLSEELVSRGHSVTVLCAVPHFPSGYVSKEYRRGVWNWEIRNGVQVCRVHVPSGDRSNLVHRLWVFLVYQWLVTLAGLRVRCDVVLVTNPAIETFLPFAVFGWLRRKPSVYAVWDVYPEVGVRMGLFRNRAVIRVVGWLEDFCLHRASRVHVLSDGFLADLTSHGLAAEQITVIPHWLDTAFIRPLSRLNLFSKENGLDDFFVVLYAGNIGLSQGLETVLESARILKDHSDVLFLFVGDGSGNSKLEIQARGISNVRFLPLQPRERLPEVLASADVSLVVLKQGIDTASLPSKLFSILASGRAVLASVDEKNDAYKLVNDSKSGLCVEPENPEKMVGAILSLYENRSRRTKLGTNGRAWAEKYHSPQSAAERFEKLLEDIVEAVS